MARAPSDRLPGHGQGRGRRWRHRHGRRHEREAALRTAFERPRASPSGASADAVGPARAVRRRAPGTSRCRCSGLADGAVVALGERDCSVQRRHQKVAEETPSPGVARRRCGRDAGRGGPGRRGRRLPRRRHGGVPASTSDAGDFVFLEMNTRLQVEHPVTELVTGHRPGRAAAARRRRRAARRSTRRAPTPRGTPSSCASTPRTRCASCPGPGAITAWEEPSGPASASTPATAPGDTVTPYYDPLLAKLVVWGADREEALERAREAVAGFVVEGPKINLPFFRELLDPGDSSAGGTTRAW